MSYDEPLVPRLYGAHDLPWIAQLLAVVERAADASWRELATQVEHAALDAEPVHRTAMFQALRQIELARERPAPVIGWPGAAELAGVANLARLQRWVRRAHTIQLRVWDGAYELARRAARLGVITELRREAGDAFVLDALGPLGVRHAALGYGRAIAALVPVLGSHARFTLDLHAELGGADVRLRLAPPILLPPAELPAEPLPDPGDPGEPPPGEPFYLPDGSPAPPRTPSAADRLAAELRALGHPIDRAPPPIAIGDHVLLPDLAMTYAGATRYLEVLAFSTRAHLVAKLARYRAAGRDVVLCVDRTYARDCDVDLPVCSYYHHVELDELFAQLGAKP